MGNSIITRENEVYEPVLDGDGRFQAAGRLLALSRIVISNKADGLLEERTSHVLSSLAEVVSLYGVAYGQGWIEGWHHAVGVREHDTWRSACRILGEPTPLTEEEIREEVVAGLVRDLQEGGGTFDPS